MENFDFSNIVYVPVKCKDCDKEGEVPTMRQFLENKETELSKTLTELGYIPISCGCKKETTEG